MGRGWVGGEVGGAESGSGTVVGVCFFFRVRGATGTSAFSLQGARPVGGGGVGGGGGGGGAGWGWGWGGRGAALACQL